MAATFGGVSVDFYYGTPPTLVTQLETYHRAGMNGIGARRLGKAQGIWTAQVSKFVANEAAAVALESSIAALVGTSISIVDGFGSTYTDCLLLEKSAPDKKAAISGATTGILVRYGFTLLRAA